MSESAAKRSPEGKQEKFLKLYEASMQILLKGSIQDLTPARLARNARISRAWIYKYFGRNREDLIKAAVQHFGRAFADLDERRPCVGVEEQVKGFTYGSNKLFSFSEKHPYIIPLYFRYRGTPTPIGKMVEGIEKEYLKVLGAEAQKNFSLSGEEAVVFADTLLSARLGLVYRWLTAEPHSRLEVGVLLETLEKWVRVSAPSK